MELKAFIDALSGDWVSLLSGIGSVVLLILGLTVFFKKPMPRWAVLIVAAVCFLLASARVWTQEHRARIRAEREIEDKLKPKFDFHLGHSAFSFDPRAKITAFLLEIYILNQGAPSVTRNWKAHYDSPTLNSDLGIVTPVDEPIMFGATGQPGAIPFYGSKSIHNITAVNPIERGSAASGRILLAIPGDKVDEITNGRALITVTIEDYLSQPYVAMYRGAGKQERLDFLPGEVPKPNPNFRQH